MECRQGCAACCIVISIGSPIPGMPDGKKAGERCVNLDSGNLCRIFGKAERPSFCLNFQADEEFCGRNNAEAFSILEALEKHTSPKR